MSDTDKALLDGIAQMEKDAPAVGLCPLPFRVLYQQVETIIRERDDLLAQIEIKTE